MKNISPDIDLPVKKEPPIADSLIILTKSYRFGQESGIGMFSSAVRDGRADDAVDILRNGRYPDIQFIDALSSGKLAELINNHIESGLKSYLQAGSIDTAFNAFSKFTVLCAVRNGPCGVHQINNQIEKSLKLKGLIDINSRWYNGRPVMITSNDYHVRLFNGDIGLIFNDIESGNRPRFFHQSADGSIKKILPLKLPEHETVYAMTVHKSQGSEFDNVILILPDRESPVLTRELLYTAITRARKKVMIAADEKILRCMINMPTVRKSGLRDALWRQPEP